MSPRDWNTLARIRKACPILYVGAAFGLAMSLLAFAGTAIPELFVIAGGISGPAVAVYGTMLFAPRDTRVRTILKGIALILIGLSHPVWMLALLQYLAPIARSPMGSFSEAAGLVTVTGMVFGCAIATMTSSVRALGVMVAATVLAAILTHLCETVLPNTPAAAGPGVGILHLAITGTLLATTLARVWPRFRLGACRACGYDLSATSSVVCPECGWDAIKWASHAK